MDIVWLVLDSLGFEHTPFASDGPETMPRLSSLAQEEGIVFERAYAPGPASPSSHAALLTGLLPSKAGMHEAYPHFDGEVRTLPEALTNTHDTYLTTVNPFLFNGLDETFGVSDDLTAEQYMVFDGASDPQNFVSQSDVESGLRNKVAFVREEGKPLRSIVNGISYKLRHREENTFIPKQIASDDNNYQYATAINEKVRSYRRRSDQSFILANYMDVHPPFTASDDAIERFADSTDSLPIGIRAEDTDAYELDEMYALYRAAIWDLDRKVGEFVEELVADDVFVVVTADHGPRFGDGSYMTEERLRVPLVIFSPNHIANTVDYTVSLCSLPETTCLVAGKETSSFDGVDLLSVKKDQIAVTEYLHRESADPGPVNSQGGDGELQYDLSLHCGNTVLTIEHGDETVTEGDENILTMLRDRAATLREENCGAWEAGVVEYDGDTEQRLRDLGYL